MSKRKQTWDNYKEKVAKKSRIDKGAAAAAGGSDGITVQRLSSQVVKVTNVLILCVAGFLSDALG